MQNHLVGNIESDYPGIAVEDNPFTFSETLL
jgi:hypothetical protein